jgi:hypothetical protein
MALVNKGFTASKLPKSGFFYSLNASIQLLPEARAKRSKA